MREVAPWKCGSGHVLGVVVKNGRGRSLLALYAEAIDPNDPGDEAPTVRGLLHGYAANIRCSICEEVLEWHEDIKGGRKTPQG